MSKENGLRSEHYVPREYMRRFCIDGKIIVHKYGNTKPFVSKKLEICTIPNFYDDGDPYDSCSVEEGLADEERDLNCQMDRILDGTNNDSGTIVRYISMMHHRSIVPRGLIEDYSCKNMEKANQKNYIGFGRKFLGRCPINQYSGELLRFEDGELIISDSPVTRVDGFKIIKENYNIEESDSNKSNGCNKEWIYVCPIEPRTCLIAYHKESQYAKFLLKKSFTLDEINKLTAHYAIQQIMYGTSISDECRDSFLDSRNPNKQLMLESVRKQEYKGKVLKKQKS